MCKFFFPKPSPYTCPINIKINMTMTAINPKNQKQVNKAIKYLTDHNAYDLKRNEAEGNDDMKAYKKYDRLCESTFDKYLDAIEFLPKNQVDAIMKSELY